MPPTVSGLSISAFATEVLPAPDCIDLTISLLCCPAAATGSIFGLWSADRPLADLSRYPLSLRRGRLGRLAFISRRRCAAKSADGADQSKLPDRQCHRSHRRRRPLSFVVQPCRSAREYVILFLDLTFERLPRQMAQATLAIWRTGRSSCWPTRHTPHCAGGSNTDFRSGLARQYSPCRR